MMAFLTRCATWALKIEAPACGARAYGLLIRTTDCEVETE